MPPFQYEQYRSPYVGAISDLIQAPSQAYAHAAQQVGQAQANAQLQSGNAWAGAAEQIGAIPGQIVKQQQEQKVQQQTAALRSQQLAAGAEQLQERQAAAKMATTINQLQANAMETQPDGTQTMNRALLRQGFTNSNVPIDLQEKTFKSLDEVDSSLQKFTALKVDHLADLAHAILTNPHGVTPESFAMGAALAQANGLVDTKQLTPLIDAISKGGDITTILQQVRGLSEKYKDINKPIVVGEGGSLLSPTGEVIGQGQPKPPTEAELALRASGGDAGKAMSLLKPPPQVTEASLDQQAQALLTKRAQGQQLSPDETAQLQAYQERKRTVSDPAALAASARQAASQEGQIAQQKRSQDFQEAQAGRHELTEKVEQPYQTAIASANTLRETVAAARAGNKVAGSLQALETTMAAIRAQGLNRINSTEIGVTSGAGNLWDHAMAAIGKATTGQPIPANIQKDMEEFAGILEKSAYDKYTQGHTAITTRYGLKDEKPLPPPSATGASAAPDLSGLTAGHGRTFTDGPYKGQTWTIGPNGQPIQVRQ